MIELATADEVAAVLHLSTASLAQMRYKGNGPKYVRVGGRRVLYRWTDVDEWVTASTRTRSDG